MSLPTLKGGQANIRKGTPRYCPRACTQVTGRYRVER